MTVLMAPKVGTAGRMYANEIDRTGWPRSPACSKAGIGNVTIVTATATDTGLPAESCDAIYMAFNRQNIEGVMDCFHENPVLVDAKGRRIEGRGEVRRCYEGAPAMTSRCGGVAVFRNSAARRPEGRGERSGNARDR